MKIKDYLKQQLFCIITYSFVIFLILLLLLAFKTNAPLMIAIFILLCFNGASCFFFNYYRKKTFYNRLLNILKPLDQKYLVTEIMERPNDFEGQLLYDILYETNKSMLENINLHKNHMNSFKEYIELWVHEVKIPLSNLNLIIHNQKSKVNSKVLSQTKKLEDYVEQVLYYVRSEAAEKDYIIKHDSLKRIVSEVILKNKDILILNQITIKTENLDYQVLTDSKWMSFIINQIINNSIKYHQDKSPEILISAKKTDEKIILSILDNGIGIASSDLYRVFEKSFTGSNGRKCSNATGMGLYICHNLCQKLGHKITITSKEGKFTEVSICFMENTFYDIVK